MPDDWYLVFKAVEALTQAMSHPTPTAALTAAVVPAPAARIAAAPLTHMSAQTVLAAVNKLAAALPPTAASDLRQIAPPAPASADPALLAAPFTAERGLKSFVSSASWLGAATSLSIARATN